MSKPIQHKMEYNGKKYVTTFSEFGVFCSLCKGCAFDVDDHCNHENGSQGCNVIKNQDWKSRIWVEDKPKKEDHRWAIEHYDKWYKQWSIWDTKITRKAARDCARTLINIKTRIRKFVPAK